MARRKQENSATGKITIYEIYTPNERFEGYRGTIQFIHGKAELPMPRRADFNDDVSFKTELEAFKAKIKTFVQEYGYDVAYREVELGSLSDRIDKEDFDPRTLFQPVVPGVTIG